MLIRGHLRLLDDRLTPDHPLRSNFDVIERATRRIEELGKRMLDFGRKQPPKIELCDAAELVAEALRFMQPYFNGQQIEVQIQFEADVAKLQVNRWQMVQAFVNLMQNAADAMSQSERRVLTIAVGADGNYLRISISDTGHGIAPSDLPHVFHPFFTTKGERGTGLGLFIVRRVVEEHNGSISVQTNDRGTNFVLVFPGA
jgi:signal transduction histidine kinase